MWRSAQMSISVTMSVAVDLVLTRRACLCRRTVAQALGRPRWPTSHARAARGVRRTVGSSIRRVASAHRQVTGVAATMRPVPRRPAFRHRHPAHRGHAAGDGRRRSRRRRLRRRPDRQRASKHAFAELLGKEAALFVPSGTMANQIASVLLVASGYRGGRRWRAPRRQPRGWARRRATRWSSSRPSTIPSGELDLDDVRRRSKRAHHHVPVSAITSRTRTWPLAARRVSLEHLDAIAAPACRCIWTARGCSTPASPRASRSRGSHAGATTVMCCLSKGLAAPVGSLLALPAALRDGRSVERKRLGRRDAPGGRPRRSRPCRARHDGRAARRRSRACGRARATRSRTAGPAGARPEAAARTSWCSATAIPTPARAISQHMGCWRHDRPGHRAPRHPLSTSTTHSIDRTWSPCWPTSS